MTRLLGLVVGIDKYPNPAHRLYGCVNDAKAIAAYVEKSYSAAADVNITTLFDAEATRENILKGLSEFLCQAERGDTVLFFYAGHGSQQAAPPEMWDVEPDRLNETLVCWDSRQPEGWDLADKELGALLKKIAFKEPKITVILDCCHSGSGTREIDFSTLERRVPIDQRVRPKESYLPEAWALHKPGASRAVSGWDFSAEGRHVLMAACRDNQTAKEYSDGKTRHGVFTYFLLDTLRTNSALTYTEVHKRTLTEVSAHFASQVPQLEATSSADLGLPFLGLAGEERTGVYTVSYESGRGWLLDAGSIHGIASAGEQETTRLAIFPLSTTMVQLEKLSNALTEARLTEVYPGESLLVPTKPTALKATNTYKAVIVAMPMPAMAVSFEGQQKALDLLREAIATASPAGQASQYVVEAGKGGQFRVLAESNQYVIASPNDDRALVETVAHFNTDSAARVVRCLEHIARWFTLCGLKSSPRTLREEDVEMTFMREKGDDRDYPSGEIRLTHTQKGDGRARPGVRIKVTNRSNRTLYCALLNLDASFGINSDFLSSGTQQVDPGQSFFARNGGDTYFFVPPELLAAGCTEVKDVVKLIASTSEFDARLLAQPGLAHARDLGIAGNQQGTTRSPGGGTLKHLLNRVQSRDMSASAEDNSAEMIDEFLTITREITTIHPTRSVRTTADRAADLGFGVSVLPHPSFRAAARLTTVPQTSRDLGPYVLPPIFRSDRGGEPGLDTETVQFGGGRGLDPGLSILEFAPLDGETLGYQEVSTERPLRVQLPMTLEEEDEVLPLGFDGTFYIPLGFGRNDGKGTMVEISRLPAPVSEETRSLTGSIRILFQKIAAKPLGLPYEYPLLSAVDIDGNGNAIYMRELAKVKERVDSTARVVLFIHGIIGDTSGMVGCLGPSGGETSILAFDYENLETTIEETAANLKTRLLAVGLGPGHGKKLQVVAHSMGGLVCRHMIERLGGKEIVSQLVMLGTPNAGSPWSKIEDWIASSIGLIINGLTSGLWSARAVWRLLRSLGKVDSTLGEMNPNSAFIKSLGQNPDPNVAYAVLAGDTQLIDRQRANMMKQFLGRVLSLAFLEQPNDIAVAVTSIRSVPETRRPAASMKTIGCDHLSYFSDPVSVGELKQALNFTG
jgi:pimeloyl-ACP methyl ester carboxylesterase